MKLKIINDIADSRTVTKSDLTLNQERIERQRTEQKVAEFLSRTAVADAEVVDIFKNSEPVHPLADGEDWTGPLLSRSGKRVADEIQEFSAEEARLRAKVAGMVILKGLED